MGTRRRDAQRDDRQARALRRDDEQLLANVAATNERYGGNALNVSRVLFVNAEVDGYHAASVLLSPPPRAADAVGGVPHHAWTYPTLPTDSDAVVQARAHRGRHAWLHGTPPAGELTRGGGRDGAPSWIAGGSCSP